MQRLTIKNRQNNPIKSKNETIITRTIKINVF